MASTDVSSLQTDYLALQKLPRTASVAASMNIRIIDPDDNQYLLTLPQNGAWFVSDALKLTVSKLN